MLSSKRVDLQAALDEAYAVQVLRAIADDEVMVGTPALHLLGLWPFIAVRRIRKPCPACGEAIAKGQQGVQYRAGSYQKEGRATWPRWKSLHLSCFLRYFLVIPAETWGQQKSRLKKGG